MIKMIFAIPFMAFFNLQAMDDDYISDEELGENIKHYHADTSFDDLVRALSTRCSVSTAHLTEQSVDIEQEDDEEDVQLPSFGGESTKVEEIEDAVMSGNIEAGAQKYTFKAGQTVPKRTEKNKRSCGKIKKSSSKKGVSPKSVGTGISPLLLNKEEDNVPIQQSTKKARIENGANEY